MSTLLELQKDIWTKEFLRCADSFDYFATKYYKTYNPETGKVETLPMQYKFLQNIVNELEYTDDRLGIIILKSRQMLVSNIGMARCLWKLLFSTRPYKIGVITRVAEQCYSTADSLFGRIEFAYEHLPPELKQTLTFARRPMLITNTNNGAQIIGSTTTKNSGRGSTLDEYWLDEAAFLGSLAESILTSIAPATQRLYIVSTPNGKNYFYYMWAQALKGVNGLRPIKLHWSQHPNRDQAWYDRKTATLTPVKRAQEYDLSFEESQEGKVFNIDLNVHMSKVSPKEAADMILKRGWKLVCGMDIGLSDDTATVTGLYNPKTEDFYIIHAMSVNNHLPEAFVGLLKKELCKVIEIPEELILSYLTVHIDPSAYNRSIATGRSAVQVYRQLGLKLFDDNRQKIKDGIADCQRWFASTKFKLCESAALFIDAITDCHYPLSRDGIVKMYDRYADKQDGVCNFNVHVMDAGRYLLSNIRKAVTNQPQFQEIDTYTPAPVSLRTRLAKNNNWR